MMRLSLVILALFLTFSVAQAQQMADSEFSVAIENPGDMRRKARFREVRRQLL